MNTTIYKIKHNIYRFGGMYRETVERVFTNRETAEYIYNELKKECNVNTGEYIELYRYNYRETNDGELRAEDIQAMHVFTDDTKF